MAYHKAIPAILLLYLFSPVAPAAEAGPTAVTLWDTSGTVHQLAAPCPFVVPDAKALDFICDALNCLLLEDETRGCIVAIPLSHVVSGGSVEGTRFRLVTRQHAVLSGRLITGFRMDEREYRPQQISGIEPLAAHLDSDPTKAYRTGWDVQLTLRNQKRLALQDCFFVDEFGIDGLTRTAEPIREIAFSTGGMCFYLPAERIKRWRSPSQGKYEEIEIEFPPGSTRTGTLLTRGMTYVSLDRPMEFHAVNREDYLVGREGEAFCLIPLPEIVACESTHDLPDWVPSGPRLVLTDSSTRQDTVVTELQAKVLAGPDAEEAILATLADLVLSTGAMGYVGVSLESAKSIEPAENGGLVLETRRGGVIAGRLLSFLTGEVYGATVDLPPDALAKCHGQFIGDWEQADRRPVAATDLDVEIVLRHGVRRRLSDAFLVDRVEQGAATRMRTGIEFPVVKGGMRQCVDLRWVRKIDRLEEGCWQVGLRSGESFEAASGFAQPDDSDGWGEPDALDFIGGWSDDALLLVPLRDVTSLRIELAEGSTPPVPTDGYPLSEVTIQPLGGEEKRVSNPTFTPPTRLPLVAELTGGAPAAYFQMGDLTRIVHLQAVSRMEIKVPEDPTFLILGKLAPFEARLFGPIAADVRWGRVELRPRDIVRLDVKSAMATDGLLRLTAPSTGTELTTQSGQTIAWDYAWIADLYLLDEGLAVRFANSFQLAREHETDELPIEKINRIEFDALPPDGMATPCRIALHGEPNAAPQRLRLLNRTDQGRHIYGPVTHDCVVGLHSRECLEIVPFPRIAILRFFAPTE